MNNMRSSWTTRVAQNLLGILCMGIVCAGLAIDAIAIVWTIIAIALGYVLTLVGQHGISLWKSRSSKISRHERGLLFLVSLMLLFLVTGTALHMLAFSCEAGYSSNEIVNGQEKLIPFNFINAEYLFRSLVCSFQLFTGNVDSNVLDGIKDHQYIKGFISLQAIISFLCTVAVLLSMVYSRLVAYYRLHRKTKIDQQSNHLYVFFGIKEPSRLLARSIKECDKDNSVVLFVENRQIDDNDQSGWNNIIGMFLHRRQTFSDVEDLDARVTFTETHLHDIDRNKLTIGSEVDILEEINLIKLRELIAQLKSVNDAQLHVFFLSDNGEENIRAMAMLAIDKTIRQVKEYTCFYCHARSNGLNRIVEDVAFKYGLQVRTVDSSQMAVELLKADGMNHPVRFVDIDKHNPATVMSSFNSLIIGFDEVGRDALKFLYEFGAFIDSSATPDDERRSPFRCVVIDKRMDELKGSFVSFNPAVMTQKNMDGSPLVELISCDCLCTDFYEKILTMDFCNKLNYIVVAMGDDELGMTMAIRIMNYIRLNRPDLHKLRIYVRSYRSDKEAYMQQLADYYNEGYNKGVPDGAFQNDAVIKLFGKSKEIYTYEMIVNEELTQRGRKYQESYARLRGESLLWDARRKKEQEKGTLDNIRSLRRKEIQDLGNALHAETKIYLLQQAMGDSYDWKDFIRRYFNDDNMPQCEGSYGNIKYPLLTKFENTVILNLARLEHIRWNASHEMLGYVKAHNGLHSCDERTREHNCLRPWQELDEESKAASSPGWQADYKLFDFSVVDNSILLNKEKLLSK